MQSQPLGARVDPGLQLAAFISSSGALSPTKANPMPELDALIQKQAQQLDRRERIKTFHELQRLGARLQPVLPWWGVVEPIDLVWEWVGGVNEHVGWAGNQLGAGAELYPHIWIDPDKQR